jgi:WhiB family redox-sensing transcriptional regulator
VSRYDWMADALCAQANPGLFHQDLGANYAAAQRICAACPVRPQCEAHAERFDAVAGRQDQHGMWAGRTRRQRVTNRVRTAREERRIEARRLIERGGMTVQEIADQVGVDVRTVWRVQKAHREQMGEAA